MYRFTNDYSEGCHPRILEALTRANLEGNFGYSTDPHCAHAAELIAQACGDPEVPVHFLVGGTQVNATVICAALRPHQAIIATQLGHPCAHETGAVEATGHKVVTVPCGPSGILEPVEIEKCMLRHVDEHNVQPKLVYISSTTEMGDVYTVEMLRELRWTCNKFGLYLYLDGARLASAMACGGATLAELRELCDAFTIGGTKNGALFGEALVIPNREIAQDFRYIMKQHGGMMAKGFLLGIQYETFFTDGLYEELGRWSTALAVRLREGMKALGVRFLAESPSNQQFPILPNAALEQLKQDFHWEVTCTYPDSQETCIRLVTSWATQEAAVDAWLSALEKALRK